MIPNAIVGAILALPAAASAGPVAHVTTHADEFGTGSECSLREAVQTANIGAPFGGCTTVETSGVTGPSVDIDAGPEPYVLTLTGPPEDANASGDIDVLADMSIVARLAPGEKSSLLSHAATVRAQTGERVFDLHQTFAAISGLGITGGVANEGAGIRLTSSLLQLSLSTVFDNHATQAPDGAGGGIGLFGGYGGLEITTSTISGNTANGPGGGIFSDFHIQLISQATIAHNTARADGAGPDGGGGLAIVTPHDARPVSSIIAANGDLGAPPAPDCAGTVLSSGTDFLGRPLAGFNLVKDLTGCDYVANSNDVLGLDPLLAPLADNGGFAMTHALLPGSPAIDAGDPDEMEKPYPSCFRFDQRGILRFGSSVSRPPCDIGAFEVTACRRIAINRTGNGIVPVAGTSNDDGFLGSEFTDEFNGAGGRDSFCAGDADDSLEGGGGGDVAAGEGGSDSAKLGRGSDEFFGGLGNDRGTLADGADRAVGGSGNDRLSGGAGRDELVGGPGNDTLNGGAGHDRCVGWIGDDTYRNCEKIVDPDR